MPEGDTLHAAARKLSPMLVGRRVAWFELPRRVESTEGIVGETVLGVEARGKNLLVHFSNGLSLHVHLKMLGRILTFARPAHRRVGPDTVVLLDTERERVLVVHAPVARLLRTRDLATDFHFRGLGPDLLGETFDLEEALDRLEHRKGTPLGVALLDQSAVAGIGNVWKSELCFNRKLDPFAPVERFTREELALLLSLARELMRETVERPRRRIPDPFTPRPGVRVARKQRRDGERPLSVYGRAELPCYDCGTPIAMRRQGEQDRSTYFCPGCQPARAG